MRSSTGGKTQTRRAILESALISPEGGTLYLSTTARSASGKTVTAVTAYRTADAAPPGPLSTWDGGYPEQLSPRSAARCSPGTGTRPPPT